TMAVMGTFSGLPEGAPLPNFLGSGLQALITYQGGPNHNDIIVFASTPTTTTLGTSQSPAGYRPAVTFPTTVRAAAGTAPPTGGSVDFYDVTTHTDLGTATAPSATSGLSST